ncbi:DDE_3 domain-containing protein [Trichonephila clavipes]|nr:DDE_3 domain-containing protein [Trichonephila clavipes]
MSRTSLYTPSKRGISIRSGARKNVLNVYSRLREEYPQESISGIVRKVSELTGVSKGTVFRLKKEKKTLSALSPDKKRPGPVEGCKNAPIYCLDETWVNEGHSETRVWQDTTIKSSYEASSSNLTVGLTAPKGKGRRLIIIHIGRKEGFVRYAADIFIGKKSGDYHEEMDGNHFEKWFETVMPKLKPQSIIVMDNVHYHSVRKEETPTSSWVKSAIQEWLTDKVTWNPDLIKIELLQKVNQIKHLYKGYRAAKSLATKF